MNAMDANGGQVKAAHMEVCFNDASKTGSVYQWWSASWFATYFKSNTTPGRWVRLPTTNTGSMACAQSWLPGTFALVP